MMGVYDDSIGADYTSAYSPWPTLSQQTGPRSRQQDGTGYETARITRSMPGQPKGDQARTIGRTGNTHYNAVSSSVDYTYRYHWEHGQRRSDTGSGSTIATLNEFIAGTKGNGNTHRNY